MSNKVLNKETNKVLNIVTKIITNKFFSGITSGLQNFFLSLFLTAAIIILSTPSAKALSGEICFDNNLMTSNIDSYGVCQKLKPVRTQLKVISIGFASGAIASMCGVVSAPVGIGLGVGSLVTQVLEGSISLACDGGVVTKEEVNQLICEKLMSAGIECQPDSVLNNP
jgi:hypothetical protein